MSLLRIYCSLLEPPLRCQWALIDERGELVQGEGPLAELPRRAEHVQLVVPASQVLITRKKLPQSARLRAGATLAFAIEDETLGEPDLNRVSRLGSFGDDDVLAVVNKAGLQRWLDALDGIAIGAYEVHCETLLVPWVSGEWSLAWDGREGCVRWGEFEGIATDCGDRQMPPLALRHALEAAAAREAKPRAIAVYLSAPNAAPDIEAWQRELGLTVRLAGPWDWRTAPTQAGTSLLQKSRRWRALPAMLPRLKVAAWVAGGALLFHAVALVTDCALLAGERRALRVQMESRFRAAFPDAVAVVDPVLQMRRKLAEARHAVGQADGGDFLPLVEKVAAAVEELPARSRRAGSYESGRLMVEFAEVNEFAVQRVEARLLQDGLSVDASAARTPSGSATVVITVRAP